MLPPQSLSFHDSTIVSVRREDDSVILVVEDVAIGDGFGDELGRGTVRFVGVRTITRDGSPVDDLVPVYEDGEIWTLDYKTEVVALTVNWTDYKTHRSQTNCYQIICGSVQIDIHESNPRQTFSGVPSFPYQLLISRVTGQVPY